MRPEEDSGGSVMSQRWYQAERFSLIGMFGAKRPLSVRLKTSLNK